MGARARRGRSLLRALQSLVRADAGEIRPRQRPDPVAPVAGLRRLSGARPRHRPAVCAAPFRLPPDRGSGLPHHGHTGAPRRDAGTDRRGAGADPGLVAGARRGRESRRRARFQLLRIGPEQCDHVRILQTLGRTHRRWQRGGRDLGPGHGRVRPDRRRDRLRDSAARDPVLGSGERLHAQIAGPWRIGARGADRGARPIARHGVAKLADRQSAPRGSGAEPGGRDRYRPGPGPRARPFADGCEFRALDRFRVCLCQ